MQTTTQEFYQLLQDVYQQFNDSFFASQLPDCLLTVQRKKNTMGYFSAHRWIGIDKVKTHEIALNPAYFATYPIVEILQTIAHEMVHMWQFEFGKQKSIRTYHNKEWADKMWSIGLEPISSNGKGTGQNVMDKPIINGLFLEVCQQLIESGFKLKMVDRLTVYQGKVTQSQVISENTEDEETEEESIDSNDYLQTMVGDLFPNIDFEQDAKLAKTKITTKVKYTCGCGHNVWGKPNLKISCDNCEEKFIPN